MLRSLISTNLPSSTLAVFLLWMLLGPQALHLSMPVAPESQEGKVIIRCLEKQPYYLTSPSPRSAGPKLILFQNPGTGSPKQKPGVQDPRLRSLDPKTHSSKTQVQAHRPFSPRSGLYPSPLPTHTGFRADVHCLLIFKSSWACVGVGERLVLKSTDSKT